MPTPLGARLLGECKYCQCSVAFTLRGHLSRHHLWLRSTTVVVIQVCVGWASARRKSSKSSSACWCSSCKRPAPVLQRTQWLQQGHAVPALPQRLDGVLIGLALVGSVPYEGSPVPEMEGGGVST
jgi:hypothetical protein